MATLTIALALTAGSAAVFACGGPTVMAVDRSNEDDSATGPPKVLFQDKFERTQLGKNWFQSGEPGVIESGELVIRNGANQPIWLQKPLPDNVRIRFNAWSETKSGDIKFEIAGDGKSKATSVNYTASGYVLVLGGWDNTTTIIARQNEHGSDRTQAKTPPIIPNKRYSIEVTRYAGTVAWALDGHSILRYDDPRPLTGQGHQHFAFSGWEAPVHFDNLVIEALTSPFPQAP